MTRGREGSGLTNPSATRDRPKARAIVPRYLWVPAQRHGMVLQAASSVAHCKSHGIFTGTVNDVEQSVPVLRRSPAAGDEQQLGAIRHQPTPVDGHSHATVDAACGLLTSPTRRPSIRAFIDATNTTKASLSLSEQMRRKSTSTWAAAVSSDSTVASCDVKSLGSRASSSALHRLLTSSAHEHQQGKCTQGSTQGHGHGLGWRAITVQHVAQK